jgi:uncharacterized protein (TIGR02996 family)
MTERDAFLREILDHPDDDATRLRFADWLEENGEPARAEFIRVQCEWAKGPQGLNCRKITGCPGGVISFELEPGQAPPEVGRRVAVRCLPRGPHGRRERWVVGSGVYGAAGSVGGYCLVEAPEPSEWRPDLRRRQRELLEAHFAEWVPGGVAALGEGMEVRFAPPGEYICCQGTFRRGFLEAVELGMDCFLRLAAALFRDHPVRELWLIGGVEWQLTERVELPVKDGVFDFTDLDPGRHWGIRREVLAALRPGGHDLLATYRSRASAERALSAACIRYGRALAAGPPASPGRQPAAGGGT